MFLNKNMCLDKKTWNSLNGDFKLYIIIINIAAGINGGFFLNIANFSKMYMIHVMIHVFHTCTLNLAIGAMADFK